jgi:hypothetical protein
MSTGKVVIEGSVRRRCRAWVRIWVGKLEGWAERERVRWAWILGVVLVGWSDLQGGKGKAPLRIGSHWGNRRYGQVGGIGRPSLKLGRLSADERADRNGRVEERRHELVDMPACQQLGVYLRAEIWVLYVQVVCVTRPGNMDGSLRRFRQGGRGW